MVDFTQLPGAIVQSRCLLLLMQRGDENSLSNLIRGD